MNTSTNLVVRGVRFPQGGFANLLKASVMGHEYRWHGRYSRNKSLGWLSRMMTREQADRFARAHWSALAISWSYWQVVPTPQSDEDETTDARAFAEKYYAAADKGD